jgi:hypothetical protein
MPVPVTVTVTVDSDLRELPKPPKGSWASALIYTLNATPIKLFFFEDFIAP